jgi:hypothetical protein
LTPVKSFFIHAKRNEDLTPQLIAGYDILHRMYRNARFFGLLFLFAIAGCGHRSVDPAAARKLSDDFMSDLIAHRTDAAFSKMEPEFTKMVNRSDFAPQLDKLLSYCGWPLNSEIKDVQSGFKIYADGRKNPIRKFVYATATNQAGKGPCFFSVDVARVETL